MRIFLIAFLLLCGCSDNLQAPPSSGACNDNGTWLYCSPGPAVIDG